MRLQQGLFVLKRIKKGKRNDLLEKLNREDLSENIDKNQIFNLEELKSKSNK